MRRKSQSLTATEMGLLTELNRGLEDKEIAAALGTSVNTVRVQFAKIRKKMQCTSRLQLALLARDKHLV